MGMEWENAGGEEYDLLRLLPPEEAAKVWNRAFRKGGSRMMRTWWAWPLLYVVSLPLWLGTVIFVWKFAPLLGGGLLGRIAAEVLAHVLLAVALHRLLKRL